MSEADSLLFKQTLYRFWFVWSIYLLYDVSCFIFQINWFPEICLNNDVLVWMNHNKFNVIRYQYLCLSFKTCWGNQKTLFQHQKFLSGFSNLIREESCWIQSKTQKWNPNKVTQNFCDCIGLNTNFTKLSLFEYKVTVLSQSVILSLISFCNTVRYCKWAVLLEDIPYHPAFNSNCACRGDQVLLLIVYCYKIIWVYLVLWKYCVL